jgi:2-oxoglutarate dehydrogenase E1 component
LSSPGNLLSTRPYNQTGVRIEILQKLGQNLLKVPSNFIVHKEIEKLLQSRSKMLSTGEGITMAFAEALAFACLMTKYSPSASGTNIHEGSTESVDIIMQVMHE